MLRCIATGFNLPSFDLSILDHIPCVYKEQYKPVSNIMDDFHWMYYEIPEYGRIGFSRNTYQHLPEVVNYTHDFLKSRFPNLPLYKERICFLQTIGSVPQHRDESSRLSCINIGLNNTSSAITRISTDDNFETFSINYKDYICEDGSVYLLNSSIVHSVIGDMEIKRTLITMTITDKYEDALKQVGIQ